MSKRKKSSPKKNENNTENWSFSSNTEKNVAETDTEEEQEQSTSSKKAKIEENVGNFVKVLSNPRNESVYLGPVGIGTTKNCMSEWKKCKVEITPSGALILDLDSVTQVIVHITVDAQFLKDVFASRALSFKFFTAQEDPSRQLSNVFLQIYLNQLPLATYNKRIAFVLKQVFEKLFCVQTENSLPSCNTVKENLEDLFNGVRDYRIKHNLLRNDEFVQHPHLLPQLRPYQVEAVRWMLQREKESFKDEQLHPMYTEIRLPCGTRIYFNKYTAEIEVTKPLVSNSFKTGGILADEMGLGKTVEVLACILANPRSKAPEDLENEVDTVPPNIETQKRIKPPKIKKAKQSKKTPDKNQKLTTKQAAQIWYQERLKEMTVSTKKKEKLVESNVRCMCGHMVNKDVIKCAQCGKIQHAVCMGFEGITNEDYFCPQCWMNKPRVVSRATLIVSPSSISGQWLAEVKRHIRRNGMKVLDYKGIHSHGSMYPTQLANYDLVITTYSVLQSEIKFVEENTTSVSLRFAKRYNAPNTPLLFVDWWRLCLDEAQVVDSPGKIVSTMASQLHAEHRWAVTGTPLQKDIKDLYGLVDYLQISPYNNPVAWKCLLCDPYFAGNKEPMYKFLASVMWRTSKNDVLEQINIPPQTMRDYWLEFSAVEKYFYQHEHALSANDFLWKLNPFKSLDITVKSLNSHVLKLILTPLLSLRQACTHPHAVRGRYLNSRRQVNTMEELLEALINKNIQECEETLRVVIAALNGLAGIYLLKNDVPAAVAYYRKALQLMADYSREEINLKIDTLQKIHTLHNLAEIFEIGVAIDVAPTLHDDKLREECNVLQLKYMDRHIAQTRTAYEEAEAATNLVKELRSKFSHEEGAWCSDLIEWMVMVGIDNELIKRIETTLDEEDAKDNLINSLTSTRVIVYKIVSWTDKVAKHLKTIYSHFKKFRTNTKEKYGVNQLLVDSVSECHLRPSKNKKGNKKDCLSCVLDSELKKYECILFQMNKKRKAGNWRASYEECIMKVVYSFSRSKNADPDLLQDGETHLALCEALRKEFKELRKLWTFYSAQIAAQDELNICKMRLRTKNPDEPDGVVEKRRNILKNLSYEIENKTEFIHILNEYELDYHVNILQNEKATNKVKLMKLLGTHKYLETLKKQQYSGQKPDPCPICTNVLSESWSILQCGHCYCLDCIHKLLEQYSNGKSVTCCVCRKKQSTEDISYIRLKDNKVKEVAIDDLKINGSYSTKVEAILKCVMKLVREDPDVKILIFSTWQPVLKIMSNALEKNSIKYEHVTSHVIQDKVDKFKNPHENITVLLLPISHGGKGLNLIEATHVILIEPLMNPGDELQAVGRVHRIGQTKPTFVHRFLVKSTIEESIHNAVSANSDKWDKNKLTLEQLKNLFADSNTSQDVSA